MLENIIKFLNSIIKKEKPTSPNSNSKETAKERLHLVLMQDRANVSADFLELMKQEIIEVIKKYIEIDEKAIDVRLTNKENSDGTNGAPTLYANIPIVNIKDETRKKAQIETEHNKEEKIEEQEKKEENASTDNKEVDKNLEKEEENSKEVNKEQDSKKEQKINEHNERENE